jgi:hypothetical protein
LGATPPVKATLKPTLIGSAARVCPIMAAIDATAISVVATNTPIKCRRVLIDSIGTLPRFSFCFERGRDRCAAVAVAMEFDRNRIVNGNPASTLQFVRNRINILR